jgi:hypothetical protein
VEDASRFIPAAGLESMRYEDSRSLFGICLFLL